MAEQEFRLVLVVDDDDAFRARIARVLRRAGLAVADARGGEEALDLAATRPGAVILEVELPDMDGLEVCHELRARHGEDLPVLMVSDDRVAPHDRVAGLLIGADDYLAKPINDDELLARLRRHMTRSRAARAAPHGERVNGLSPREVEVLRLLAQGLTAEKIADRLVISQKTVSSHIQRVMAKLDVHTRAQAVAEAYRIGLADGDFEGHALLVEPVVETSGERLAPPPVSVP